MQSCCQILHCFQMIILDMVLKLKTLGNIFNYLFNHHCHPCITMETFHAISCITLCTCQPSNTMGCHANAGRTVPCCCKHDVHARETLTFQDVTGPLNDEPVSHYCPIFVQLMCKKRDNCRMNRICGQKDDKCRTSVSLLFHFCPAYVQKKRHL